ncbi:MAG: KTSC domain-containing protein [Acidobacteriota bacterium]
MPSSVIRAMRFDPARRVLEIVFRGAAGVYRYLGVPMEEWRRFRGAPAKGAYLNGIFKGQGYRFEKVPRPPVYGEDEQAHSHENRQGKTETEPLLWGEAGAFPEPPAKRCQAEHGEREDLDELAA